MGCDIHTIVQYRKDGNWTENDTVPAAFYFRDYTTFALIAKGVRGDFGYVSEEIKGLPDDLYTMKFNFEPQRDWLEKCWREGTQMMFHDKNGNMLFPEESECATTVSVGEGKTIQENIDKKVESYVKRYYNLHFKYSFNPKKCYYVVYDANIKGGYFEPAENSVIWPRFRDFCKDNGKMYWDEDMLDYGIWGIDFTCVDYHSHSYLNLDELELILKRAKKENIKEMGNFESGVKDLRKIAKERNIKDKKDIRIVFAFDN